MKKSLLFLAVVALVGCKGTESQLNNSTQTGLGGITTPKERNYTASELTIARRICSALKHKREFFDTLTNMQEQFKFRGELKNCDSTTPYGLNEFTANISTVSTTDFEYVANANKYNYFKDVVTDQSGAMKSFCEAVTTSDNVSNTVLSGSSYLITNVLISEGYDRYEISKKSRDAAGNYNLVSIEGVNVITQKNQAEEKFFGVEKKRVRYSACPNSKDFSSVGQLWLQALTSF